MPEPIVPLPTDHAFVLQLEESHGRPGTCRAGRVELLASGEATRFATTAELWAFVDSMLARINGVLAAKRARAFIDGHFRGPVRMADLCRATGVGVRTLQRRFRQCFGVTVTSYLKAVRLDAAYRDLIAADPSRDAVTTIAVCNGCNHLGRFSSEFRERFGQLPRETLRSDPSAFAQLRGGPQPASPSQLMQRAARSVEPPAGPTAVCEGRHNDLALARSPIKSRLSLGD